MSPLLMLVEESILIKPSKNSFSLLAVAVLNKQALIYKIFTSPR